MTLAMETLRRIREVLESRAGKGMRYQGRKSQRQTDIRTHKGGTSGRLVSPASGFYYNLRLLLLSSPLFLLSSPPLLPFSLLIHLFVV